MSYVRRNEYRAVLAHIEKTAQTCRPGDEARAWEQAANTYYALALVFAGDKDRHDECWNLYRQADQMAADYRRRAA